MREGGKQRLMNGALLIGASHMYPQDAILAGAAKLAVGWEIVDLELIEVDQQIERIRSGTINV